MALVSVTPLEEGVITHTQINSIVSTFVTDYNGNITDANFSPYADINGTKITDATIISRKYKPTSGAARSTAAVNLSATYKDITGCSVDISCDIASTVIVTGIFEFYGVVLASGNVYGLLDVDGTDQSGLACVDSNSTSAVKATIGQVWSVNVTAGVHTFKLQAKTSVDNGSEYCNATNSCLLYEVISQ